MSRPILPPIPGIQVGTIRADADQIIREAETIRTSVPCPDGQTPATRIHRHYRRMVADLAWRTLPVTPHVTSRKWRCDNPMCPRAIFVERLAAGLAVYARQTATMIAGIAALGATTSSRQAAQLAADHGLRMSPITVLRRVQAQPDPPFAAPRGVGIDDWAWRKGHTSGTIVVDLERHHVIDVLPDRQPATVESWLKDHPTVRGGGGAGTGPLGMRRR